MVSGFFDPRAAIHAMKGVPPRVQYSGRDGTYSYVVGERDPHTGRYVPKHTPLPFGFRAIVDMGTAQRGFMSYKPFDDSHLVPMHQPVDPNPPGPDYARVIRFNLHLETHGPAQLTLSGIIAQNSVFALFAGYQHATEAAAGKIPVWMFHQSEQITLRNRSGEIHWAPRISTCGWVARDVDRWGARTVPVPVAQVGNDNGGIPPLLPLVDPVAPTPTRPLPPANDAAPPANDDDPFAGMLPSRDAPPF